MAAEGSKDEDILLKFHQDPPGGRREGASFHGRVRGYKQQIIGCLMKPDDDDGSTQ